MAVNEITFNMKNIRLISAEITNRPYKKIIPNCTLSGGTSATATIVTNVCKPLTITALGIPHWIPTSEKNFNENSPCSLVFGNGVWIVPCWNCVIFVSNDNCLSWSSRTFSPVGWVDAAYGNNIWMTISNPDGIVMVSSDNGNTWTNKSARLGTGSWQGWQRIVYYNNQWIVLNEGGRKIASTNDGDSWTETSAPDSIFDKSVAYGNGKTMRINNNNMVEENSETGTIGYMLPSGEAKSTDITNAQTVTISPETHKYEPQSDGTYKITLTLDNVTVSNAQMVSTDTVFDYLPLRLPDTTVTRTVDYSQNGPAYYPSNTSINTANLSDFLDNWYYDSNCGYYRTKLPNQGYYTHTNLNGVYGDHFVLVDDIGESTPQMFFARKDGWDTLRGGRVSTNHYFSGLHRLYKTFAEFSPVEQSGRPAFFDLEKGLRNLDACLVFQGFTSPINTALYYGASGSSLGTYRWHRDAGGNVAYDATQAAGA
jgi:hypothetical protein